MCVCFKNILVAIANCVCVLNILVSIALFAFSEEHYRCLDMPGVGTQSCTHDIIYA